MNSEDEARRLRQRARAALEVHRPALAAADATRAIGLEPGSAQGHLILGWALLALDKPREALDAVDAGLAHVAEEPLLHRLRSVVLFDLERFDEALQAADAALALDPQLSYAHSSRAFALSALGRKEEALEAATTAVSIEPEEADHHAKLSVERMEMDPVLSERHARAALALSPEDVGALTLLGGALVRQRREEEACEVWREAVRLEPTAPTAKAALVHHLDAELDLGMLRRPLLPLLERLLASMPPDEAGLGRKFLAMLRLLAAFVVLKVLLGLVALGKPLRQARLRRRMPAVYALYLRLKEDGDVRALRKKR